MPLIPACLHAYAVSSVLSGLMNTYAGNFRLWHKADGHMWNVRYEWNKGKVDAAQYIIPS